MKTTTAETIDFLIVGRVESSKGFLREKRDKGDTRALRAVIDAPAEFISGYLDSHDITHEPIPHLGAVRVSVFEEELPLIHELAEQRYVNFIARIDPETGAYTRC